MSIYCCFPVHDFLRRSLSALALLVPLYFGSSVHADNFEERDESGRAIHEESSDQETEKVKIKLIRTTTYKSKLREMCEYAEIDGHVDEFRSVLVLMSKEDSHGCPNCRAFIRTFESACAAKPPPRVKATPVVEADGTASPLPSGEHGASPSPSSSTQPLIAQHVPHPAMVDLFDEILDEINKREQPEGAAQLFETFRHIFREVASKGKNAAQYLEILSELIDSYETNGVAGPAADNKQATKAQVDPEAEKKALEKMFE